jgi:hypothetical protein
MHPRRTLIAAIVPLLATLWFAISLAGDAPSPPLAPMFPETIGGLTLVELLEGDAAIQDIGDLHGKAILLEDAVVATYAGGPGRPDQVWISRAASVEENQQQMQVMVEKMLAAQDSPFRDYRSRETSCCMVHEFTGMGQVHYTFAHQDLSWWISSHPMYGEMLLESFLP